MGAMTPAALAAMLQLSLVDTKGIQKLVAPNAVTSKMKYRVWLRQVVVYVRATFPLVKRAAKFANSRHLMTNIT